MKVSAVFGTNQAGGIECLICSEDAHKVSALFNELRSSGGNGYKRIALVVRPILWKECKFNAAVAEVPTSPPRRRK